GLTALLKQEEWASLVEGYLEEVAPHCRFLGRVGERLPEFLKTKSNLPYGQICEELASLDWAYLDVFDEEDAPPLDAEKLLSVPADCWPQVKLVVNPALRILELEYPSADFRRQLLQEGFQNTLPEPIAPYFLVIYRRQGKLWDKSLSRPAGIFLQRLQQGDELAVACQNVVEQCPEAEQSLEDQLSEWMQLWGTLEWIVDLKYELER
ncbi:MAG: hypothetical protein MK135_02695, partial [Polyangiaceae bacterium]|nr:hypothetical protein [Polyangiaceae bacterium]